MARNLVAAGHGLVAVPGRSPLAPSPGFRVRLRQKDLGLALDSARVLGASLPDTAIAQDLFKACAGRRGGGDADHSPLVRAIAVLSGRELTDGKA